MVRRGSSSDGSWPPFPAKKTVKLLFESEQIEKNDPSYQVALVAALEGVHLLVALALVKVVLLQTGHHLHHLRVAGQFYSY